MAGTSPIQAGSVNISGTATSANTYFFGAAGSAGTVAVTAAGGGTALAAPVAFAGTASLYSRMINTNSLAAASTWGLMQNGSATTLLVSVNAAATGAFTDSTHSVSIAQNDTIENYLTAAGGSSVGFGDGRSFVYASNTYCGLFQCCNGGTNNWAGNSTHYVPISGDPGTISATETDAQVLVPSACTVSYGYAGTATNGAGTLTATVRAGGASTSVAASITAATTGVFTDTTHTASISAGALLDIQITGASGGSNFFHLSSGAWAQYSAAAGVNVGGTVSAGMSYTSGTSFATLAMPRTSESLEARCQTVLEYAWAWQNLTAVVATNANTGTVAVVSRGNTATLNQALSIATTLTGTFADSTHTDTIVAGRLYNYQTSGGATSAIKFSSITSTLTDPSATDPATGSGTATSASPTFSGAGILEYSGAGIGLLQSPTASSDGTLDVSGPAIGMCPAPRLIASGMIGPSPVTGDAILLLPSPLALAGGGTWIWQSPPPDTSVWIVIPW